jgi:hypothetical protein
MPTDNATTAHIILNVDFISHLFSSGGGKAAPP